MRLMLGLDRGEGETKWDGRRLTDHPHATKVVGAHLDARFFNPNRTARAHLRMLGAEANIPNTRVDEVLDLVGLTSEAKKRPKTFSLGMGQRLGLAGAILANPKVLVLDMSRVPDIEYSALQMLIDGESRHRENGITLWLAGLNPGVLEVVRHTALAERLGRERMLFNTRAAMLSPCTRPMVPA